MQYIGTFAVSLGTGGEGENTLKTHKERTSFVKKKLNEYRVGWIFFYCWINCIAYIESYMRSTKSKGYIIFFIKWKHFLKDSCFLSHTFW